MVGLGICALVYDGGCEWWCGNGYVYLERGGGYGRDFNICGSGTCTPCCGFEIELYGIVIYLLWYVLLYAVVAYGDGSLSVAIREAPLACGEVVGNGALGGWCGDIGEGNGAAKACGCGGDGGCGWCKYAYLTGEGVCAAGVSEVIAGGGEGNVVGAGGGKAVGGIWKIAVIAIAKVPVVEYAARLCGVYLLLEGGGEACAYGIECEVYLGAAQDDDGCGE